MIDLIDYANIEIGTGTFKVTVQTDSLTPIAGATVRVLNGAGVDVSANLYGLQGVTSDSNGVVQVSFLLPGGGFPTGIAYTIQVNAPGFPTFTYLTDSGFNGNISLVATLTAKAVYTPDAYTVSIPGLLTGPQGPMSSMLPVVAEVVSKNNFEWEYIRATIENADGSKSVLEAPVERKTGKARIDFRNRAKLGIRPNIIADGYISQVDTDFSGIVSIRLSSLSAIGESPITFGLTDGEGEVLDSFTQALAQTYPIESLGNLANYVTATNRDWLVPFQPVTVFRGYYYDVGVWLPMQPQTDYQLNRTFYDASGAAISASPISLTFSPFVQRIRVETNPNDLYKKMVMQITDGTTPITKPLTINYRD